MGGKAQRRREKNFRKSHGGNNHLPPPPTLKELEAIPAKLRRLIDLQSNPPLPKKRNKNDDSSRKGEGSAPERGKDQINGATQEETKRKRKRKNSNDIFHDKSFSVGPVQVRNRKKEYFEARKKRKKKVKADDVREFPGHEDIKFGDVVQAPLKLYQKKAFTSHDASHERVRLKTVEAYRSLKGWVSRPGVKL